MKPGRSGQSGCMQGFDTTMKCLGRLLKGGVLNLRPFSGDVIEDADSGSPRAEAEVMRRVTKSRGVVGPGNCADR